MIAGQPAVQYNVLWARAIRPYKKMYSAPAQEKTRTIEEKPAMSTPSWTKIKKVENVPTGRDFWFFCPDESPQYVIGYRHAVAGATWLTYRDERLQDRCVKPKATHYAEMSVMTPPDKE